MGSGSGSMRLGKSSIAWTRCSSRCGHRLVPASSWCRLRSARCFPPIHAPFGRRLQLEPFERKPDRVCTRPYRTNWPIKRGGDDLWPGADLGHLSKEIVLIGSPAAVRGFRHLQHQSSCGQISGLQISPSGVGLQPMQGHRVVEHILRGIVLAEKRSQEVTLKFLGLPLPPI